MKRLIFISLLGLAVVSCSQKESIKTNKTPEQKGIRVKVTRVLSENSDAILAYSGISEPTLIVPLSFQLPGKVVQINVDEGTHVRKGQVLAELDKNTYQNSYNAALALQKQAEDAYNRLKKVYEKGSLPEIKWQEVKAKLEQANSTAAIAKQNLDNAKLTSPIDGIISLRNIEEGANIAPGVPVFRVVSVKDILVKISVPDNEINRIQKAQVAQINFPALGNSVYQATVHKIGVTANTISKTFEVKLKIPNSDLVIKPGMVCEIELPLSNKNSGVLIPIQSAMKDENGTNYVFVVEEETHTAHRQNIQSGGIVNNKLSIVSGIQQGDLLVVEGQHKLTDNSKVQIN